MTTATANMFPKPIRVGLFATSVFAALAIVVAVFIAAALRTDNGQPQSTDLSTDVSVQSVALDVSVQDQLAAELDAIHNNRGTVANTAPAPAVSVQDQLAAELDAIHNNRGNLETAPALSDLFSLPSFEDVIIGQEYMFIPARAHTPIETTPALPLGLRPEPGAANE